MTVSELIAELQQYDPFLPVVCPSCSEYVLVEYGDIRILPLCEPRPDGWVHAYRPDKPTREYLVLPG